MLEARRARHRPRPRERLLVAQVRQERRPSKCSARSRTSSRCRAASTTSGRSHGSDPFARYASREQVHGRAVLERDAARLDRRVEAVGRRHRRDDRHGRLGVSSEETISRSPCSGFVGMPVDGPARWMSQITSGSSSCIASPIVSCFRTMPGPADVVTAERAAERRAERRACSCDLVLGLERPHAELLVARELLEDRRGRRDRIRAEEERQPRQLRRRDQPVRERLVAGDVAVDPRRELRRLDLVGDRERLRRLAERVAGLQRLDVRLRDLRPLARTSRSGTTRSRRPGGRTATTSARARTCSSSARPRAT